LLLLHSYPPYVVYIIHLIRICHRERSACRELDRKKATIARGPLSNATPIGLDSHRLCKQLSEPDLGLGCHRTRVVLG